jgi:peptidoglycan/LPS O-acetylase OafA/YrhL
MSDSVRRTSRNHVFDLLRIIFATLVLLSHAPELTDGNASRELWSRATHGTMTFGALAVDGFFLLSGFLIVQSWDRDPELLNYLRKRLLRIVPGYLVAVILSIVVVGLAAPAVNHFFLHLDRFTLPSILILSSPDTPAVYPGDTYHLVNGSLWTISYEFRCYLLVALLGLLGLLRRRWLCLALVCALLVVMSSFRLTVDLSWYRHLFFTGVPEQVFRLTAAFLVGTCFYLFRDRVRFAPWYAAAAVVMMIAVRVLAFRRLEAAILVGGGYLLFYAGSLSLPWLDWMRRVPDISYGIYLYGWPVETLWIWFHHGSPWATFAVSTPICFALGWLSWHLVERPALTLKRRATAPIAGSYAAQLPEKSFDRSRVVTASRARDQFS